MAEATGVALADAGGRGLAASVDRVAVPRAAGPIPIPHASWPPGSGHRVRSRTWLSSASHSRASSTTPWPPCSPEPPRWPWWSGRGEAVGPGPRAGRPRAHRDGPAQGGPRRAPPAGRPLLEPVEVAHRLWEPVQQYAMIDNALRAAEGLAPAGQRTEIDTLWERMSDVSAANPDAAFGGHRDAAWLGTPSPDNRPLAFPYNKWHSTQWTVNQAAALVICSVAAARRAGVPEDRWVFPLVGLESSHAVSVLCRRRIGSWPAMEVLGGTAAARIGRGLDEVEVVELSSSSPRPSGSSNGNSACRWTAPDGHRGHGVRRGTVQQRRAAVRRLGGAPPAVRPGALGAVTTVSGLLTKPGLGISFLRGPTVDHPSCPIWPTRWRPSPRWSRRWRPWTGTRVQARWLPTPSPTTGWILSGSWPVRHGRRSAVRGHQRGHDARHDSGPRKSSSGPPC